MSRDLGPVKILGAEASDTGTTVRLADGREFLDADIALPESQIEQIRLGYRCIRCLEPQSEAYPVVCESRLPEEVGGQRWCNFPIREKQAAEFAAMYKGEIHIGSRVNLSDEMTRMEEMAEYERKHGIVLPDSVKFPNGPV